MRRWLIVLLITLAISTVATLHAANVNVTIHGEVSIGGGSRDEPNAFFAGHAVTGTAETEENGSITISIERVIPDHPPVTGTQSIVSGKKFDFGQLAPGKYTLTASASGYTDTTKTVWVIDIVSLKATGKDKNGKAIEALDGGELVLPLKTPAAGGPSSAKCTLEVTAAPDLAALSASDRTDMLNYLAVAIISGNVADPSQGGVYDSGKLVLATTLSPSGDASSSKTSSGLAQFTAAAGVGPNISRDNPTNGTNSKQITIRVECAECLAGTCSPGSSNTSNDCIQFSAVLGWNGGIGARAGFVSKTPSSSLTKLSGLTLSGLSTTSIKMQDGIIRQTLSAQALTDFVQVDDFKYEMRFYNRNVIGQPDASGVYSPSGPPYQTVTVENPDNTPENEHILVTNSGTGEISDFVYTGTGWKLTKNGKVETVDEAYDSATTETIETRSIRNSSNALVSRVQTVYRDFPWMKRVKIREINDPDGKALTTRWSYYDQKSDQINYRQLKQVVHPNGYWERYEYSSRGRTKTVAQFLNAPVGAPENQSKVTLTIYNDEVDKEIVTLLGTEISCTYTVQGAGYTSIVRCQTPGASQDAADNLVTTTWFYASGVGKGKRQKIARPDGTISLYTYTTGSNGEETTEVSEGAPGAGGNSVSDGTRTVTTENEAGTVIAEARYDIASNLLLESWDATSFDSLGRVTGKAYNDGTTESFTYACCYLESETDRDGVTTTYSETPGGQAKTRTRFGITEITTYDPMDRLLKRIRKGTNNSEITLEDNNYNLAGELILSKNALDRETLYAEQQAAGTTKTTTFPDGGVQIEATAGDGTLLSVTGTAVAPVKYEPGVEEGMQVVKEIKVGDGGAETEWTKTFTDMLGRAVKTVAANGAIQVNVYSNAGQLIKTVDPDNVTMLYSYNAKGEQTAAVLDMDRDGNIDWSGGDRITTTAQNVLSAHGTTVRRTVASRWAEDGVDAGTIVSTVDQSLDGLRSWQTTFGQTVTSVTQRLGGGGRTVTTTSSDGTYTIQQHDVGQLISTVRFDSNNNQVSAMNFTYDAHGRLRTQTDARTGTTTTAYNDGDQVISVAEPNPSGSGSPLATVYDYDLMGRRTGVQLPDGTWTYTIYDLRGNVTRNFGSQTYDVSYTFDAQNRMKTTTTTGQAGNAVTTWNYDPQTGRLLNKRYADNKGPSYAHSLGGKLHTRTWARLVGSDPRVTTYGYNAAGELASVDYSDTTPDVAYTHDRLGRTTFITDATGTRTFAYRQNDLQLASEKVPSLDRVLTRKYDGLSRDAGFTLGTTADPDSDHEVTYGYDTAGRLNTVTDGGGIRTYTFVPNSNLRASLTGLHHVTTYTYESGRDALLSVENKVGATTISKHAYDVNSIGQRKNVVQTGTAFTASAFNLYNYNATGEVTTAKRYEGTNIGDTGLPVPDYDFGYTYDPIGNRLTASPPGSATPTTYTGNTLNQYLSTTDPSQIFIHDADGNLISNGDWTYSWDGENRLVRAANITTGVTVDFVYDYHSRRFRKTVTTSGSATIDQIFLYDGWNVIATYDYQPSTGHLSLFTTYTWGLDLSGTLHDVGGVGGLLGSNDFAGVSPGRKEYTFDGNGNVSELVNASEFIIAHYEYGPFGEALRATGVMAKANPFRWSTRYTDDETGIVMYPLRPYSPATGRWLSRDRAGQEGGENLYGFVDDDPIGYIDALGLWKAKPGNKGKDLAAYEAEKGDTIAGLAGIRGLKASEYKKWLTGKMPASENEEVCGNYKVPKRKKVPVYRPDGTLVGYDWMNVGGSPKYDLQTKLTAAGQARRVHGLYFWGHGGSGGLNADAGNYFGPQTEMVDYDTVSVAYGLGLLWVYACESAYAQPVLGSGEPGMDVRGSATGTLIPLPFGFYIDTGGH